MSTITGYSKEELVTIDPNEMLVGDSKKLFADRIRRQIAGDKIDDSVEFKVRKKDGSIMYTTLNIAFSHDSPNIAFVIGHDVTERRQAEEKLKESEERFRALVATGADTIYRMSPNWSEMLQLNSQGFLSGTEQLNPNWLQEYIPTEDQPHVTEVINEAIRTKSTFEMEHQVYQADGGIGWTLSRAIPRLDAEGNIVEWFGSASNITQRKQAEEALKGSQKQLQDIIDGAPNSIFVKDLQGRFMTINTQLEKLLGKTREEVKGKTDYEIISRNHAENYRDNDRRIAETDKSEQLEEEADLADGRRHYFLANKFPLHDIHGKTYAVASLSNNTHLNRTVYLATKTVEILLNCLEFFR